MKDSIEKILDLAATDCFGSHVYECEPVDTLVADLVSRIEQLEEAQKVLIRLTRNVKFKQFTMENPDVTQDMKNC